MSDYWPGVFSDSRGLSKFYGVQTVRREVDMLGRHPWLGRCTSIRCDTELYLKKKDQKGKQAPRTSPTPRQDGKNRLDRLSILGIIEWGCHCTPAIVVAGKLGPAQLRSWNCAAERGNHFTPLLEASQPPSSPGSPGVAVVWRAGRPSLSKSTMP